MRKQKIIAFASGLMALVLNCFADVIKSSLKWCCNPKNKTVLFV
jgi:hypothetical protein